MPSKQPKPLFLNNANLCLATDLYQLTMIAGYFECGKNHKSTFELFVRNLTEKTFVSHCCGSGAGYPLSQESKIYGRVFEVSKEPSGFQEREQGVF